MTKKDYIKIARAIKDSQTSYGNNKQASVRMLALNIANILQQDNPQFDRTRFMTACGFDN